MKVPRHEATTAQLGSAYPFVANAVLPIDRVVIGRDLHGALFAYDPFDLYLAGILTNPNMVVLGQLGRGKSALIKSYLYRQFAYGRRVVLIDPKGEYCDFADALGAKIIRLEPGGSVSLNPLADLYHHGRKELDKAHQHATFAAICSVSVGRSLDPGESVALQCALDAANGRCSATLPEVVAELFQPQACTAHNLHLSVEELARMGRVPGYALQRLLGGEFTGMFDTRVSPEIELDNDILVFDVSMFYRSTALSVLLVCIFGALQQTFTRTTSPTLCVLDEAWAVLSNPYAAKYIQSLFKLARSYGVSNVLVAHRPSDFVLDGATGAAGGSHVRGLLSDCETVVCYAQSPQEVELAQRLFDLNDRLSTLLPQLGRGIALWKVAQQMFLVEHRLGSQELAFVDTDSRMRLS